MSLVESEFAPVAEAFEELHQAGEEIGSAVCVMVHGRPVIDLWAGSMSPDAQRPWQRDTRASTFSASKALVALCLLHLIDQGAASLDDPVVLHWPEFSRVDRDRKSRVTLAHLLDHTAGLQTTRTHSPGDVYDWERMIDGLERAPLLWEAGSQTAYHAVTFGHLIGEVVRRISGLMPSAYFEQHFAGPLDLEASLRYLPEHAERTADCDGPGWSVWCTGVVMSYLVPPISGWKLQYYRPCGADYHPNTEAWRAAEAPAVTGFASARALARVYAMLLGEGELDGVRVLSPAMARNIAGLDARPPVVREHGTGHDARIRLGFFFNHAPLAEFGSNPNAFGHCGMGGTTAFADPDWGVAFGYSCNRLHMPSLRDQSMYGDRALRLISALYECLGACAGSTAAMDGARGLTGASPTA